MYVLFFARCITSLFFFFNDTATTEIYTLSLHDALPIWGDIVLTDIKTAEMSKVVENTYRDINIAFANELAKDRKSTRLNSSHANISYAVFCLKKKKKKKYNLIIT